MNALLIYGKEAKLYWFRVFVVWLIDPFSVLIGVATLRKYPICHAVDFFPRYDNFLSGCKLLSVNS
ncbi:hypothetical protein Lepto7376_4494 [[Leptolyngbya] sp. PCC 7376]|uniref:hypothetical protein n=1 Tax=[Leptolyngbya] sp. PCC 7376 TaxID=111781 RepID=UPI00029F1B3B|nr:hypothetical protein [[Leptolyngbya] sp. PCC 7376]AFY40597.1 hypothetical protein Lepto7376_4494 [[Leptolyngbya] sp. PCC 7376]